jgi:hypothetical protein
MTLSRFLRDYLHVPLGGNRLGRRRRYVNLLATMVLGGLWHGAAWTFVVWGALHGMYLCIYHGWSALRARMGRVRATPSRLGIAGARALTLVAVVVGWVFFRAESIPAALAILKGMSGANGIEIPQRYADLFIVSAMAANGMVDVATSAGSGDDRQLVWTLLLLALALFFPNSNGLARSPAGYAPALRARGMLLLLGVLIPVALLLLMINASRGISEFIYFNF